MEAGLDSLEAVAVAFGNVGALQRTTAFRGQKEESFSRSYPRLLYSINLSDVNII